MGSSKHLDRAPARLLRRSALALGITAAGISAGASAFVIGTENPDLELKWDNTFRVNAGWRVEDIDDAMGDNWQYDESEYKFEEGDMFAQRLDLYSEFDIVWRSDYGARLSVAGWYDHAYHDTDVEQNPALAYLPSSYRDKEYSNLIKRFLRGPSGEVLDAFVFANHTVGEIPLSLKAGQFTTFWGMAVFYQGGIAQSQHPIDGRKGAASPGSEVKELFLPLSQVNLQSQFTPAIAAEVQYYLDWANTRAPEGGTFLGPADLTMQGPHQSGGDPLLGQNLPRHAPLQPDDQHGNWGVNFKFSPDFLQGQSVGIYYREFDEKIPWLFIVTPASLEQPRSFGYRAVYAENTKLAGVSFDGSIGQWSVGAELGYHMDTGLKSVGFSVADEGARGDTWHALLNGIYLLDRGALWDGGELVVEMSYDRLDDVTENEDLFMRVDRSTCMVGRTGRIGSWKDNCATKDAIGLAVRIAPKWLQVLPSLDVVMPMSYQTGLDGNSAITSYGVNRDAATLSLGVQLDYKVIHRLTLTYDDYFSKRHTSNGLLVSGNGSSYMLNDRGRVTLTYKVAF